MSEPTGNSVWRTHAELMEAESYKWRTRAEVAEHMLSMAQVRVLILEFVAKSAVIVFDGAQNLTGSQAAAIDALRRRVEEVGK